MNVLFLEATPPSTDPSSGLGLLVSLIPLVVPVIVAGLKWTIAKLPSWSLPIIATSLGALLNYILTLTGQPHTNVIVGALLGAAGVGVREIVDQVKNVAPPNTSSKTP